MLTTDPVADMLTQIRNAVTVKKSETILPYSKLKHALVQVLQKQGWIESVAVLDSVAVAAKKASPKKFLSVKFKYDDKGTPVIQGVRRVSKPGQRIYIKAQEIPGFRLGVGATIISTSKGLMTDREARSQKLGGEVICQIW